MDFLILILEITVIFCSFFTITAPNPVYSALFLILAFLDSSLILIAIGADFIGLMLTIVYVGAVSIIFLFVVMLLNIQPPLFKENSLNFIPLLTLICLSAMIFSFSIFGLFFETNLFSVSYFFSDWTELFAFSPVPKISATLYESRSLSFILVAFILLVAMVVAIFLSNLQHLSKRQDLFNQVYFS